MLWCGVTYLLFKLYINYSKGFMKSVEVGCEEDWVSAPCLPKPTIAYSTSFLYKPKQ